jgi:hypothetical protein
MRRFLGLAAVVVTAAAALAGTRLICRPDRLTPEPENTDTSGQRQTGSARAAKRRRGACRRPSVFPPSEVL